MTPPDAPEVPPQDPGRGGQEPYDVKAPDPFGRKPLKLVGPRFHGLDAREAVEAARHPDDLAGIAEPEED